MDCKVKDYSGKDTDFLMMALDACKQRHPHASPDAKIVIEKNVLAICAELERRDKEVTENIAELKRRLRASA